MWLRAAVEGSGVQLLADDLQWADADSLALLKAIVDDQPPGVMLVATVRRGGGPTGRSRDRWRRPRPPRRTRLVRRLREGGAVAEAASPALTAARIAEEQRAYGLGAAADGAGRC